MTKQTLLEAMREKAKSLSAFDLDREYRLSVDADDDLTFRPYLFWRAALEEERERRAAPEALDFLVSNRIVENPGYRLDPDARVELTGQFTVPLTPELRARIERQPDLGAEVKGGRWDGLRLAFENNRIGCSDCRGYGTILVPPDTEDEVPIEEWPEELCKTCGGTGMR